MLLSLSWRAFSWEVQRFQPGDEGLPMALTRSLALGIRMGTSGALVLDCCCPDNSLPLRSFCPVLLLLTMGEPLITRTTIELGPFQNLTSVGRDPDPLPTSGRSISQLLKATHLPPPSPADFCHCFRAFLLRFNPASHVSLKPH